MHNCVADKVSGIEAVIVIVRHFSDIVAYKRIYVKISEACRLILVVYVIDTYYDRVKTFYAYRSYEEGYIYAVNIYNYPIDCIYVDIIIDSGIYFFF